MYRRGAKKPDIISGLVFCKYTDTIHHYKFNIPKYNHMSTDNFIPYIYLNDTSVGNKCDVKLRATIENDEKINYVRVFIDSPTDVGYILKVEVDDETFIKMT
jgi:hypothetical protein